MVSEQQMRDRLGHAVAAKVQMILLGEVLYRRVDGGWEAYDED